MPTTRRLHHGSRMLSAIAGAAAASSAWAQASYQQYFDNVGPVGSGQHGPSGLIAEGYQFRNQSDPVGTGYWYEYAGFAQAGPAHLGVDSMVGMHATATSKASSWMLLPPIQNQTAGDQLKFFIQNGWSAIGNNAHLEVRYSPTGGTSTGSGASAVGDFTTLLADIPALNGRPWTEQVFTLPGSGRIAFRFVIPPTQTSVYFFGDFQIDTLTIGEIGGSFPIPDPGETVHWTLAMSPIEVTYDTMIPAGGRVIVDPGVEVRVAPTMKLHFLGDLEAREGTTFVVPVNSQLNVHSSGVFAGTTAQPIELTGGAAWFGGDNGYQVKHTGTVTLAHVNTDAMIKHAAYSYSTGGGLIAASSVHAAGPGAGFYIDHGTLALRDSSFSAGASLALNESYVVIDRTTFDASYFLNTRYRTGQPVYLNNLVATNNPADSTFLLEGFDHFFGPSNTITGNLYPVHLRGGGIAPGSTVPSSGNINNYIHGGIGEIIGRATFANAGPFYRIDWDSSVPQQGGPLTFEPGVTVRLGPDAYLWPTFGSEFDARGTPDAPITFERFNPGVPWQSITFSVNGTRPKLEHVIVRGSELGVIADETVVRVEDSTFEGNQVAARPANFGLFYARKSRFLSNQIGVQTAFGSPGSGIGAGHADLNGITNPNAFEGNGIALQVLNPQNTEYAPNNWWDSPTGPTHPSNPGGTGDVVQGNAVVVPFRTTPPDFEDNPPLVRLNPHSWLLEGGRRVILTWNAADDGAITGYRVLFSGHSECYTLVPIATGIPGSARSVEITVPAYVPSNCIDPAVLRVEATDDAGQVGYDEIMFFTPNTDVQGSVTPVPVAGPLRPGQRVDICYQVQAGASGTTDVYLFIDDENWAQSLGGAHTGVTCLSLGLTTPPVSTDLARIGVRYNSGAGGRNPWQFTPYFSIRPDPGAGDAPPTIQMTSPAPGQSFPGGGTVPVSWAGADDEAVRSFDIQASYDAGRTWNTIARKLSGTATSYQWKLPPSAGIPDVRVRVLARDLRFQVSSSGGDVPLSITPGSICYPDCTGEGQLTVADFGCFQTKFVAADPYADCNSDGQLTVADFGCFQTRFASGCP